MPNLEELTTAQPDDWLRTLEQCGPYDFYHLPAYHALAEEAVEGKARLLVYREGSHVIALPLLLRSLDTFAESDGIEPGWQDATSVYGYPGPIASAGPIPGAVVRNFQAALREDLRRNRVVTVFSRLHPLLTQRPLLASLGEFQVSQTVSIDLTLPPETQRAKYRKSLKDAIKKLRQTGMTIVHDTDGSYLEPFLAIYYETMRRVGAAERYFFPPSYFDGLRQSLGSRMHLFLGCQEGKPVCGGMFIACNGILQFHLAGTLDEVKQHAPIKLLLDEVRLWAIAQGLRVMHLGGGATSDPEDPLLYFKRGFSDRFHEFATWRWIVAPEQDAVLRDENARRLARQGLRLAQTNFFPGYRDSGVPCEPPAAVNEAGAASSPLVSGGTP